MACSKKVSHLPIFHGLAAFKYKNDNLMVKGVDLGGGKVIDIGNGESSGGPDHVKSATTSNVPMCQQQHSSKVRKRKEKCTIT